MKVSLSVLLLLLGVVLCAGQALLVRKSIVGREVVYGQNLVINVEIYNVGQTPVYNIILEDLEYKIDDWEHVSGLYSAKWDRLNPGQNFTHSYVVRPRPLTRAQREANLLAGNYPHIASAIVRYNEGSATARQQLALSSRYDYLRILGKGESELKISASLKDWSVFVVLTTIALGLPAGAWLYFTVHYQDSRRRN
eukprot:TRINITY_DN2972_c0_g1_i1.p1 TRINITY_DN2972_c0_g1~~TRINITY_DN2972_c0_g1_i1.p1  ORF type:complete len:195 (+),score=34.36 TRINITY_DN2972_c0_g1_i1:178-762(+)